MSSRAKGLGVCGRLLVEGMGDGDEEDMSESQGLGTRGLSDSDSPNMDLWCSLVVGAGLPCAPLQVRSLSAVLLLFYFVTMEYLKELLDIRGFIVG